MMQELYEVNKKFYKDIEQEFGVFRFGKYEWESLHLRYLIYYLTKYEIHSRKSFTAYHYRVSYRIYLLNFINSATA